MSKAGCQNSECTVAQTGLCLLNNQPDECPNRLSGSEMAFDADVDSTPDEKVLSSLEDTPRFPPSTVMGMDDVRNVMGKEYYSIVGLLGPPNSGKTACLVSLYLLLSHNRFDGFTFADSKSLVALDELSRGARRWQDGMPEQMTAHTGHGDGRYAGFVHFKLVRNSDSARLNLLVPDLPGEWTNNLIDSNRTERLTFLRAADAIWVMVNGETLIDKTQRLGMIHRTNLLVDRIAELFCPDIPTVHLVVSHADMGTPNKKSLQKLQDNALQLGIDMPISHISSFSKSRGVPAGMGISDLIAKTVVVPSCDNEFWPGKLARALGSRNSLRVNLEGIS